MENTPSERGKPLKEKEQHRELQALWQAQQTEATLVVWKEMQNLQRLQHFAALTGAASSSRAHTGDQLQTELGVYFKLDAQIYTVAERVLLTWKEKLLITQDMQQKPEAT